MKNKRGQFYIIAAIIIVFFVSGFLNVKTEISVRPKPRSIEGIKAELKGESFKIVDYGIYNKKDTIELLNNFTKSYAPYFLKKTENANIIFVYGNSTDLFSAKFDNFGSGKISANMGSTVTNWQMITEFVNRTRVYDDGSGKVKVSIFDKEYEFDIKNNEMFYFVIVQEKEGEVYVERS